MKAADEEPAAQVPEAVVASGGADRPRHRLLLERRTGRGSRSRWSVAKRGGGLAPAAGEGGGEGHEQAACEREHDERPPPAAVRDKELHAVDHRGLPERAGRSGDPEEEAAPGLGHGPSDHREHDRNARPGHGDADEHAAVDREVERTGGDRDEEQPRRIEGRAHRNHFPVPELVGVCARDGLRDAPEDVLDGEREGVRLAAPPEVGGHGHEEEAEARPDPVPDEQDRARADEHDDRATHVGRVAFRLRHGHAGETPIPRSGGAKGSPSGWSAPVRRVVAVHSNPDARRRPDGTGWGTKAAHRRANPAYPRRARAIAVRVGRDAAPHPAVRVVSRGVVSRFANPTCWPRRATTGSRWFIVVNTH